MESTNSALLSEEEIIADITLPAPGRCPVMNYDPTSFPTGTILVSRESIYEVLYHSNDVNCHASILLWYYTDTVDRLALGYEAGKTKPMTFEVLSIDKNFNAVVLELGTSNRLVEYGYPPRQELLSHPRYLETIARLIKVLTLAYLVNKPFYSFAYKWQSTILRPPHLAGYPHVREYYLQLEKLGENIFESKFKKAEVVSSSCVDLVINFVSLLHEKLYINLTEQELLTGGIPAERKILADVYDYDVSRLIRPTSDLFQLYEREPRHYLSKKELAWYDPSVKCFLFPVFLGAIFFIGVYFLIRPFLKLLYYGPGIKELFLRR